jgi:septal ring factor EnvC (AmiA/AmiB activator)
MTPATEATAPATPPTFEEATRAYEIAAADLETIDRDVRATSDAISKLYKQLEALQSRQEIVRAELKRTHDAVMEAAKREWPLPWQCTLSPRNA